MSTHADEGLVVPRQYLCLLLVRPDAPFLARFGRGRDGRELGFLSGRERVDICCVPSPLEHAGQKKNHGNQRDWQYVVLNTLPDVQS